MRDGIDLKYYRKRLEEQHAVIMAGEETKKSEAPVEPDQAGGDKAGNGGA